MKDLENEILDNYGIDATRIFMVSDSPPDRELEWTDEGIQSSKNLINRIERYFNYEKTSISDLTIKNVEKFTFHILMIENKAVTIIRVLVNSNSWFNHKLIIGL